jgi:hypothetical protein
MKRIGCKNFINQIEELELGQAPDAGIQAHLQVCVSCQSFYDDRLKLREMVAGLGPVEAPGDFGFRVRARLANEAGNSTSPFSIAGFGFGLPSIALAIIALLVGVGLYSRFMSEPRVEQPLAEAGSQPNSVPTRVASAVPEVKSANATVERSEQTAQSPTNDPVSTGIEQSRNLRPRRKINSNLRRDNFLARSEMTPTFPLEATEPVRVSVDYATGGSRTISVPAVSFGSEQVVARGASMVKTSARTVW